MGSRERTKLYIVIGLSVVFIAVGYFRFFHGKITFFNQPERSAAIPAAISVPAVDLKAVQPAGKPQSMAPEGPRAGLRDIFAPAKAPVKEAAKGTAAEIPAVTVTPAPLKPLPPLQLTGTIVGGKQPLAIINGRFLRRGEVIAGFEVVSIARDQVTLWGEGRKVLLNTLTGAEERSR